MALTYVQIVSIFFGLILVLAYALLSSNVISAKSYTYQAINLVGSIGILMTTDFKYAAGAFIINIFWSLIAFMSLCNLYRLSRSAGHQ